MSATSTDDWLSGVLADEVPVKNNADAGAASSNADAHTLTITGRVPVTKDSLALVDATGGDAQKFTLEYAFAEPISTEYLAFMPIIVDADADTFKMADRAGVHNVRVNGQALEEGAWSVARWRLEYSFFGPAQKMGVDKSDLERWFQVKIGDESLFVIKHEIVGGGRAVRVLTVEEEGTTGERLISSKNGVRLDNVAHAFRHAVDEASRDAFVLSISAFESEPIRTVTYDLVTSGLNLGLELEQDAIDQDNSAHFNLILRASRPSLLAPSQIQALLGYTPTRVQLDGTAGYYGGAAMRFAQDEQQAVLYAEKTRSMSRGEPSYASNAQRSNAVTAFSSKRPGARFRSALQNAPQHNTTRFRARARGNFRFKADRYLTVVYLITGEERFPAAPELILWGVQVESEKNAGAVRAFIDTLPSNLRIRRRIPGKDQIEADLDTDTIHVPREDGPVKLAAYVDEQSILNTLIPAVVLRSTNVTDNRRTMRIEVTPGSNVTACILFSSAHYTSASLTPDSGGTLGNARDRERVFMGGREARLETSTIQDAVFVVSNSKRSIGLEVTAVTTAVRK